MLKAILEKLRNFRLSKIHEGIKKQVFRRKILRQLKEQLAFFDNVMKPVHINGRILNSPELMEAKRNGAYDLYHIAKSYQNLSEEK